MAQWETERERKRANPVIESLKGKWGIELQHCSFSIKLQPVLISALYNAGLKMNAFLPFLTIYNFSVFSKIEMMLNLKQFFCLCALSALNGLSVVFVAFPSKSFHSFLFFFFLLLNHTLYHLYVMPINITKCAHYAALNVAGDADTDFPVKLH